MFDADLTSSCQHLSKKLGSLFSEELECHCVCWHLILSISSAFPLKFCWFDTLCAEQSNLQRKTQSDMGLVVVKGLDKAVSSAGWEEFVSHTCALWDHRCHLPRVVLKEVPQFEMLYLRICLELEQPCISCGMVMHPPCYFPPPAAGYSLCRAAVDFCMLLLDLFNVT